MKKKYQIFLYIFFISLPVLPQEDALYVNFDRLTIEERLSHNNVLCIEQDDRGFLWFGTADGLNRYDGYDFTVYKTILKKQNSISNNIIRSICKAHDGTLWIGTENGLNRYIDSLDCFVRYLHEPDNPNSLSGNAINTIFEDSNHRLWIGTKSEGLNKFNPETGNFEHYKHDPIDPNSLSGNEIISIHEDRNGNLWVGTFANGLNLLNKAENNFFRFTPEPGNPNSIHNHTYFNIFESSDGVLYVFGGRIIDQLESIESDHTVAFKKIKPIHTSITINKKVRSMIEDNNKNIWIGYADLGLCEFNPDKGFIRPYRSINKNGSLNKYVINDIFQDNNGILWIATHEKGILKYDPKKQKFGHLKRISGENNSLSGNIVLSILESSDQSLWIGTRSNGLNYIPKEHTKKLSTHWPEIKHIFANPNDERTMGFNTILSIYEDTKNMIWIGTSSGLLNVKRSELKNMKYLEYSFLSKINNKKITPAVWKIYQDQDGIFWVCTREGLYSFDYYNENPSLTQYTHKAEDNSISDDFVWDVFEDSKNRIWIATSNGLNLLNKETGRFTIFKNDKKNDASISSNNIKSIYEDSKNRIWISTEGGGLNQFIEKDNQFITYSKEEGLPNNTIWGILEDNRCNLWLSTNNGLSKFSPEKESFINYYSGDGLQSNEFKMGAFHKGQSGRFYFGGINGLNAFSPSAIKTDPVPPDVYITDFKIFNNSVEIGEKTNQNTILDMSIIMSDHITLSYKDNFFSFEFVALHYNNPSKNKYAYKMEGFNNQWVSTQADKRYATYTNLPGGNYTFKVKACNPDGVWNHEGTSINIHIISSFWKSTWFYLLLVVVIILIIFIYLKIREKTLKREQTLLSNEQKLLQTLMDNIPDTIYFKDKHSRFTRVNQAKAIELGLNKPEELIGKTDFDYFDEEDAREAYEDEQEIIKTGKPLINKVEERITKQGERNWFLATKVPIKNDKGIITGTVGLTRNITDQKRAEIELNTAKKKAEKADNLKSAFLANMSHEIRTPMNAILGFSRLLEDPALSDKERASYIEYIRNNGQSLLNIINDIIDIAKIEAGEITISEKNFDVHRVIDELKIYYDQEINAQNKKELKLNIKKGLSKKEFMIVSDPLRIKQVLSNLISNALKFTDKGHITFGYELKGDTLEFFVHDTGIGIDVDKLDLIFERFRHFGNDFKKNISGTGLGLAISKKLIELLGGKIWVESTVDKGSSFYFTIPFKQ